MTMKKKRLFPAMMAAGAAIIAGLSASPSGQQVAQQAINQAKVVEQQANRAVNQGQQMQARSQTPVQRVAVQNPYAPGGDRFIISSYGMSPKEYGQYLQASGRDKYNKRKRMQYRKGRC